MEDGRRQSIKNYKADKNFASKFRRSELFVEKRLKNKSKFRRNDLKGLRLTTTPLQERYKMKTSKQSAIGSRQKNNLAI
jgi:hypothetical protein